MASGTVVKVIDRLDAQSEVERHPTTGERLRGFRLPLWDTALRLVEAAAVHFPGLRLQNWDVAFSETGPVLIELNTEAELGVPQAVTGKGILDAELRSLLKQVEQENARPFPAHYPNPLGS
jgi:hypothetical protein